jgi:hypothetical protein
VEQYQACSAFLSSDQCRHFRKLSTGSSFGEFCNFQLRSAAFVVLLAFTRSEFVSMSGESNVRLVHIEV